MTDAPSLADWLLERIAADEAAARAAGGEEWYPAEVPGPTMRKSDDRQVAIIIDSPRTLISYEVVSDEVAQHIARHDPARVLARCEADRRIVGACSAMLAETGWEYDDAPDLAERILTALASVYADAPGWREEWR